MMASPKISLRLWILLACLSGHTFCVDVLHAASPSTVYVYDMDQGGDPEREMMASLAGVVARTSAEVAMGFKLSEFDADPEFWVDQYVAQNPGTQKIWRGWEEWFIDRYKNDLAGYVVYDPDSINQATSVAGALGALMVDESLLAGPIGTALTNAGLNQVEDVRGRSNGWVYLNYSSQFNKDVIFRQQPTLSHQLRSFAVKEGGFVFDETGFFRDIYLAGQNDHSLVYGWGYNNSENEFFSSATKNNLMAVPADHLQSAGPFSAWDTEIPQQVAHTPTDIPTDPGKHYVAFVMSDGDNIQWLTNIFRDERWFGSPYRGDFDMTFDISPSLKDANPVALKYFYEEVAADENKTFFVTPGGHGLTYPSLTTDVSGFMDATVSAMNAVDQNIISVLDDGPGAPDFTVYNEMVAHEDVMGMMLKTGPAYTGLDGEIFWHNGKPIVSTKYTLWDGFDTPDDIVSGLNAAPTDPLNDQGSYTIVNLNPWATDPAGGGQGDPMSNVNYMLQHLDSDVELVTLEELIIHLRNNFGTPVAPSFEPGDFDEDGDVDGMDFLSWQSGFGIMSGAEISDGDANDDGKVDNLDLQIWQANYGNSSSGSPSTTTVPEPSCMVLASMLGLICFCYRR